ncbi:reticulon-like protein B11 [Curcuma longa]|uniref:reticulon-like protein B11 n=1 Tax=Curcuma longa TaxID=136217 RepID=UPI003D9F3572
MATMPDLEHDAPPSASSPFPPAQIRRSLHLALGGGAVADVLLWRRRKAAVFVVSVATSVWFLFEWSDYNFLPFMVNAILLLVVILFFWAKSALLLNRPLPPLPNLEVSDEMVNKGAERVQVWLNRILDIGHDIAIGRDRKVLLQVIMTLWVVSYIGSLFNFITLVYIGVLLAITIPAVYGKYQDHVDQKLEVVHNVVLKQYGNMLTRVQEQSTKHKKTQ